MNDRKLKVNCVSFHACLGGEEEENGLNGQKTCNGTAE